MSSYKLQTLHAHTPLLNKLMTMITTLSQSTRHPLLYSFEHCIAITVTAAVSLLLLLLVLLLVHFHAT
jgi:hypothetical protein